MQLTIHFEARGTVSTFRRLVTALRESGQELHENMAMGVEAAIKDHLQARGYVGRVNSLGGKSTGFWGKVSNSIESHAQSDSAVVRIPHRGAALRYYGGVVKQRPSGPLLSIPVHPSAYNTFARTYKKVPLKFIPARGAKAKAGTKGYLVMAREGIAQGGKNKGKRIYKAIPPSLGGKIIYVLRTETTHQPDPGMLPTQDELQAAATEAGQAYIDSLTDS